MNELQLTPSNNSLFLVKDLDNFFILNEVFSYYCDCLQDDEKLAAAQVKKDVHDIILEFIRSRPPLHPVRVCQRSMYTVTSILTSYLCFVNRRRIIAHAIDGGAASR
jgi:hypothetical protein